MIRDFLEVHLVDWNLFVNFGWDPECLSMIRTSSTKLECLEVKRIILILDSQFWYYLWYFGPLDKFEICIWTCFHIRTRSREARMSFRMVLDHIKPLWGCWFSIVQACIAITMCCMGSQSRFWSSWVFVIAFTNMMTRSRKVEGLVYTFACTSTCSRRGWGWLRLLFAFADRMAHSRLRQSWRAPHSRRLGRDRGGLLGQLHFCAS